MARMRAQSYAVKQYALLDGNTAPPLQGDQAVLLPVLLTSVGKTRSKKAFSAQAKNIFYGCVIPAAGL